MGRISGRDALYSITPLVKDGKLERAAEVLVLASQSVRSSADWRALLEGWNLVGEAFVIQSERFSACYANALRGVRAPAKLEDFSRRALEFYPDSTSIAVERAWALFVLKRFTDAKLILERLATTESIRERGIAQRILGSIGFAQSQDWIPHFELACTLLTGRELGLALGEYGSSLLDSGDYHKAREIFFEARVALKGDVFYLAWLEYSLGLSFMRAGDARGESHFLESERLTRQPEANAFRSRAWFGVGGVRRLQGELERALYAYRLALRAALEPDDLAFARWGVAHCLRLMDAPSQSLNELHAALEHGAPAWLWADVAAVNTELGDLKGAKRALERAGVLHDHNAQRAAVVRAELARQEKDLNLVLQHLEILPKDGIIAREESQRFGLLFTIWNATMGHQIQAIEPQSSLVVDVRAHGALRVNVNGRKVGLRPASKPAEVLVLLLERGGSASTEDLAEELFKNAASSEKRKNQQAVSAAVRQLRSVLGWETSVISGGRVYELDPKAIWNYDRDGTTRFLPGVSSDWVVEKDLELN
jgi:tetratricopeptide (TPR) repeat protein